MKLEAISNKTTEVFVEHGDFTVMCNLWFNCEGVNVMLLGKDAVIRGSFALRWEEMDALICAMTAARVT